MGYLKLAHQFLDKNPEAKESPRLALDLMMMGKAAEDLKSIVRYRSFAFRVFRISPKSSFY